ncbi:hypothetical protein ACIOHB_31015 [Streptomyces microflavus]|uniref:hypothetical protein n=1 Tax=Streptomyces microflavus TaxID=1919 RepID=UPI003818B6C3
MHDVVERFAKNTDVDESAVRDILSTPDMARLVEEEAMRLMPASFHGPYRTRLIGRFECTTAPTPDIAARGVTEESARAVLARGWVAPPTARLDSIDNMKAHSIGEHVWCSATARWTLSGVAELRHRHVGLVGCSWATRVLLSTTQRAAEPILMRSDSPLPITPIEMNRLPSLEFEDSGPTRSTQLESQLDALVNRASTNKALYMRRHDYQLLLEDLRRDLLDDEGA